MARYEMSLGMHTAEWKLGGKVHIEWREETAHLSHASFTVRYLESEFLPSLSAGSDAVAGHFIMLSVEHKLPKGFGLEASIVQAWDEQSLSAKVSIGMPALFGLAKPYAGYRFGDHDGFLFRVDILGLKRRR